MEILASRPGNVDETLVYYVSPRGEIVLAPDNRIKDPALVGKPSWHCFEAVTAKEKESIATRMAAQLWAKKKDMEIARHMREQAKRNELRASAHLRLARSTNKFDAECQKAIIRKMDEDDEKFFRLLAEEFDPTRRTSGLEIEFREAAIGWAARGEKRAGLNVQ